MGWIAVGEPAKVFPMLCPDELGVKLAAEAEQMGQMGLILHLDHGVVLKRRCGAEHSLRRGWLWVYPSENPSRTSGCGRQGMGNTKIVLATKHPGTIVALRIWRHAARAGQQADGCASGAPELCCRDLKLRPK